MTASKLSGTATERIEKGQLVLVRAGLATIAEPSIANGIATETVEARHWGRFDRVRGLGQRSLQAMADGPLMDPLRLYLPDGRLSEAELQKRTRQQFNDAGIE